MVRFPVGTMRRKWLWTGIAGVGAIVVLMVAAAPTLQASEESLENQAISEAWFPKDTMACIRIPSAVELRRRWSQSSFGAMQEDPAFAKFFADIRGQLDDWTRGPRQVLGLDLIYLWQAAEGELAAAIVLTSDQQLALLAVVDLGETAESGTPMIQEMEQDLEASGAERLTIEASGQEVISWSRQQQGDKQSFSYIIRDGQLVLSNTMPALIETLARVEAGGEETSSANSKFHQIMEQAEGDQETGAVQWYVDPNRMVTALLAPNLQGTPQADMVRRFLDSSGLGQLQAIGGSLDLAAGNYDSVRRTVGLVPEEPKGLLRAFALEATPQRPPLWVADDVSLYAQINWSFPDAYKAVSEFYDSIAGEGTFGNAVGNMTLGDTELQLKRDLIDPLVGPIHIVADIPASFENVLDQPVVFAVNVRDAEHAQQVLRTLAQTAGAESRDIEGTQMQELKLPSLLPGQEIRVAATLAEGSLMISTDAGYLEQMLRQRGEKRPLAESLAYQSVAEHYPERTSLISFQRQDRDFRALYESVRAGALIPPLPGIVSPLDFSQLPPFEAMSRYLQTTGSYIEPTGTGFRMVDFALPPREQ